MTQVAQSELSGSGLILKMGLELSARVWRFASAVSPGHRPRQKSIQVVSLDSLRVEVTREVEAAKKKLGLPASARVVACYEAGREGHWVRRFLESLGVECLVIHASSTRVDRRRRRAKTDRLDALMLVDSLMGYLAGDRRAFRVIHALSVEAEDARHHRRHLEVLRKDKAAVGNRVRSLLVTQGVVGRIRIDGKLAEGLESLRCWDGSPLPPGLLARLSEEMKRWIELDERIGCEVARRKQLMAEGAFGSEEAVRLQRMRSLGEETSSVLATEGLGYRNFRNGRQVGAYCGLTPTPYASGQSRRELGIGKDGNARVRRVGIELAWLWLRLQPDSELTLWFHRRFGDGSKRIRRIGIVALARRLMIALWRYLDQGIVPAGAVLKG